MIFFFFSNFKRQPCQSNLMMEGVKSGHVPLLFFNLTSLLFPWVLVNNGLWFSKLSVYTVYMSCYWSELIPLFRRLGNFWIEPLLFPFSPLQIAPPVRQRFGSSSYQFKMTQLLIRRSNGKHVFRGDYSARSDLLPTPLLSQAYIQAVQK